MALADALAVIAPEHSRADARELLAGARRSQAEWRRHAITDRLAMIAAVRDRLANNASALAAAIERRPLQDSLTGEILPLLEACRYLERHAARLLRPQKSRGRFGIWLSGVQLEIEREPFGTVLIVGPSNYGLMLPGIQALQAIVAGNAVILKPAPGSRQILERFVALLEQSGLPTGLVTVTDEAIGIVAELIDAGVDKLVFTGSSTTGRKLLQQATDAMLPATVELSGWDACIVLESADLDRVARAIAFAMNFNAGETCLAPRRILLPRSMRDDLISRLGDYLAESGPIDFARASRNIAQQLIADAVSRGAHLACGELRSTGPVGPVLLTEVSADMPIFTTEVFGPIALMTAVDDSAAAIRLANCTRYALGATVFGHRAEATEIARRLDAGLVMINDTIVPAAHPAVPIAPRRGSGFGSTRGADGLLEFTRPKALLVNRSRKPAHLNSLTADTSSADMVRLLSAYIRSAYRRRLSDRIRAAFGSVSALIGVLRSEKN
jgi:acyl-CoA reductase-like NAD-dependent aldehyde dehydrogenase